MSYSSALKTFLGTNIISFQIFLSVQNTFIMTKFEKREIARNSNITRLLWFSFGFLCAFILMCILKSKV